MDETDKAAQAYTSHKELLPSSSNAIEFYNQVKASLPFPMPMANSQSQRVFDTEKTEGTQRNMEWAI